MENTSKFMPCWFRTILQIEKESMAPQWLRSKWAKPHSHTITAQYEKFKTPLQWLVPWTRVAGMLLVFKSQSQIQTWILTWDVIYSSLAWAAHQWQHWCRACTCRRQYTWVWVNVTLEIILLQKQITGMFVIQIIYIYEWGIVIW